MNSNFLVVQKKKKKKFENTPHLLISNSPRSTSCSPTESKSEVRQLCLLRLRVLLQEEEQEERSFRVKLLSQSLPCSTGY